MNVIVRVDASWHLGAGHVMRCLSLARVLANQGVEVAFAVNPMAESIVPFLGQRGYCVAIAESAEAMIGRWQSGCDWLVVDNYDLDAEFERSLRPWAKHILVVDDLADRAHDCDLLLDPTLGRQKSDYLQWTNDGTTLLLGPEYALLRKQFVDQRDIALRRRKQVMTERQGVERFLVNFGGTDPGNITELALRAIAEAGFSGYVDVVTGLASSSKQKSLLESDHYPFSINVMSGVEDMAAQMVDADISIGAAGSTAWERCVLGLPTLMVTVASNQRLIAQSLDAAGAAVDMGWGRDLEITKLAETLRHLCEDHLFRFELSNNAARICDGLGANRVADLMRY